MCIRDRAIIILKSGRYIEEKNAMEHIAGYACYNDATVRDWQKHTSQFIPGKNFNKTGAFGPYMLTTDEVSNYKDLKLQTRLNGEVMQDASLSDLIFPLEIEVLTLVTFTLNIFSIAFLISNTLEFLATKKEY